MSPELLDPDRFGSKDGRPTKASDCYALGMVIYEVLSRQAPFASYGYCTVMRKVTEGERLGRPEEVGRVWFTDDLWKMLNLCWATQPEGRPSVEAVLECLEPISRAWKPPSPQVYKGVEMDEDDRDLTTASADFSGTVLCFDSLHFTSPGEILCLLYPRSSIRIGSGRGHTKKSCCDEGFTDGTIPLNRAVGRGQRVRRERVVGHADDFWVTWFMVLPMCYAYARHVGAKYQMMISTCAFLAAAGVYMGSSILLRTRTMDRRASFPAQAISGTTVSPGNPLCH